MKNNYWWVKAFVVSSILLGCWLPTALAAVNIDVEMRLNDGGFVSYDHFKAELYMNNLGSMAPGATIFGILEVLGEFFFWPSFSSEVDFDVMDIPPGETIVVFLEFDFENIDAFIPFGPMRFWGAWYLDMTTWKYDSREFWLDSAHKWTPAPTNTPANTPTPPPFDGAEFIPPGEYDRGSPDTEPCRQPDETLHHVRLTRGFYIWKKETNRYLWKSLKFYYPTILPDDPSDTVVSPTDLHPVQNCTWNETILFANLTSIYFGVTQCYYKDINFTIPVDVTNYTVGDFYCNFDANGWRLPTEAEWEYACRAGTTGAFSCNEPLYYAGNCGSCAPGTHPTLELYCRYCANSTGTSGIGGSKNPNPWGLYDMHGNVFEWCWDLWDDYPMGTITDPTGAASGMIRVVRSGGFGNTAERTRSARRNYLLPNSRGNVLGFRLVSTYNPGAPTPTPTPTSPPDIPLLVYFAPGIYTMGSPEDEACRNVDEIQHQVTLTKGFYMMDSEVTRLMWSYLKSQQPTLPDDPSDVAISPTGNHAAQKMSWYHAVLFANLSSIEVGKTQCYYKDSEYTIPVDATNYTAGKVFWNRAADGWRLPTEAEWEYACRAGTIGAFSCDEPLYDSVNCHSCVPGTLPTLELYCWYCGNQSLADQKVRSKEPNPAGVYDMHGNMLEWCWDWFDDYPTEPTTDPAGPTTGVARVIRGGAFNNSPSLCRSAFRHGGSPSNVHYNVGFRMVRTVF
ncbi:MAG: SUMF1/EgtB/PvdO family nonheme iron enzyme [bacterium]